MNFNNHSALEGKHAYLGASSYHWINYDDTKLIDNYHNLLAKERGTRLHEFARECIELGQKLPRVGKTLNMYVNDAIGYKMQPEQILYYSDFCFGTADCISFRKNFLRIHDLKTGVTPAHIEQLLVYSALFCLEYKFKPSELDGIELRIYQNDEVIIEEPSNDDIVHIMDKIIHFDKLLNNVLEEEEL